jgi:hypothetical protein
LILRNESGLKFVDISSEEVREYRYGDGTVLTIEDPRFLHVSKSGGHRILDGQEQSWYIAPGWKAIRWKVPPGAPHFVK